MISFRQFHLFHFTATADLKAPDAPAAIKKYFNLESSANELRLLTNGGAKVRFSGVEHYMNVYSGIPVEHSSYAVISRDGKNYFC